MGLQDKNNEVKAPVAPNATPANDTKPATPAPAGAAAPQAAPAAEPKPAPTAKPDAEAEKELRMFAEKCEQIFNEVKKDIIGQTEVVQLTIMAIIAGGNVLLEGAPGLGKTRLVRSLGNVFDLPFSRIQFTPDLMPADVTGTNIITRSRRVSFRKYPAHSPRKSVG